MISASVAALLDGPTTIAPRDGAPITFSHERILAAFHRLSDADQRLSIEIPALAHRRSGERRHRQACISARAIDTSSTLRQAATGFRSPSRTRSSRSTRRRSKPPCHCLQSRNAEPLRALAASGAKLTVTRASLTNGALDHFGRRQFHADAARPSRRQARNRHQRSRSLYRGAERDTAAR